MLPPTYIFPSPNNFRVYQFLAARMIAYGNGLELCDINSEAYIANEMARQAAIRKHREEVLEQMDRSLSRSQALVPQ